MEARSGALGDQSETKRARKEKGSKWHLRVGREDGDAVDVHRGGAL